MTRIDFYILADASQHGRPLLACRLVDKAYRLGHRIYIHTESEQHTTHMDDLLWTFSQGSFLPHALSTSVTDSAPPILIGHTHELSPACETGSDVLINLAGSVPLFFSRFARVAEIIDQSSSHKQAGRERYRFYRDRGYDLQSHNVATPEFDT